jgi:hypothetical protein
MVAPPISPYSCSAKHTMLSPKTALKDASAAAVAALEPPRR